MRPAPAVLTAIRWLLLIGLSLSGLYFLTDALFSGWVAGGPPEPHKLGWERRSLASLLLSIASFLAATGTFRALSRVPHIGTVSWALLILAAALSLTPFAAREVLIDSCLDSGGRWSSAFLECEAK